MRRLAWIFVLYAAAIGVVGGLVLMIVPQAAHSALPPYFWILIGLLLFDAVTYLRARGAPGTMISMGTRLAGFLIALVVMAAATWLSGNQVQFF